MTPSMNERVLQRRKLLNTAKLPERRCHMRPTSRSDDSMVTGVGSQTTTDDVRSFSRIDCETWEESVLSLPVHHTGGISNAHESKVERKQNNRTISILRLLEKRNFIVKCWGRIRGPDISRGGVGDGSDGIAELAALSSCSCN